MNKYPYMQIFWKDFLYDRAVFALSSWGFRLWTYALGAMWEDGRSGKLSGTVEDLCKIAGMQPAEVESALDDIQRCNTGEISRCNGTVTMVNRRMAREAAERVRIASAVKKHRKESKGVTVDVTECNGGKITDCNGHTRAGYGDSSFLPSASPESLQQQQQQSREAVTAGNRKPKRDNGWPAWITTAAVYGWFRDRLKSDAAATDLADRWLDFNCHVDRWRHATAGNWRYFCARFLAEEIKRNGHPDKRYFAYRDTSEQFLVETLAAEDRADAGTVAAALDAMRKGCGRHVHDQTGADNEN